MELTPPRAAPCNPSGPVPVRRHGSVRRTTTIDTDWPEGPGKPMRMVGRGRDMLTDRFGRATVLDSQRIDILASGRREILSIGALPERIDLRPLVGARAGGHSRALLADVMPDERTGGTLLHFLIDDFAGASLVAGWAWSQWRADWLEAGKSSGAQNDRARRGVMEGICAGFRPGASSLNPDGTARADVQSSAVVGSLVNASDPEGWHELPGQVSVGMRRARWTDVWRENGSVRIQAGFQDSATSPGGGRIAIHEYLIEARAGGPYFELTELAVDPRILPYTECTGATGNTGRLIGRSLADFRHSVLEALPGTLGCTHLNDILRSLADVPQIIGTERISDAL